MTIKDRINKALNRIQENQKVKQILNYGMISLIALSSHGKIQAADTQQDNTNAPKTENVINLDTTKHYIRYVDINSVDELRYGQHSAAEYIDGIGIVYTQFRMEDANRSEQNQINMVNSHNYSVETEEHENLHRQLSNIHQKIYDGSCVLKISDQIRIQMMEEICALKAEKGYSSIQDAIDQFKNQKRDQYYSRIYGQEIGKRWCTTLIARLAEEKIPEKVALGFDRTRQYKPMQINGQDYLANLYTSRDKKYQTWMLHDSKDEFVTSPEILSQCNLPIGVLCTSDGEEVKMPDGKKAMASYAYEADNGYGGWGGYSYFAVDNADNIKQGYDFSKLDQNFKSIFEEYATTINLNNTEKETLQKYLLEETQNLNAYDMSDKEIKEVKESYHDYSLSQLQNMQKNHYKASLDKSIKQNMEGLTEVEAPSKSNGKTKYMNLNNIKGRGGK